MKTIEVVAAIIRNQDQILCVQRPEHKYNYISKKFEFPGGKVELDESSEEALRREIQEELSLDIEVNERLLTVNHEYPDFSIKMHGYLCECEDRELILNEHIDHKWLDASKLSDLDWAAADIPIVEKLIRER